jgi:phosphate transport system protein
MKLDITQGHTVVSFSNDLARLRSLVLEMGEMVVEQVNKAITALIDGDMILGRLVVERSRQVHDLDMRANEEIMQILALRHPVATDLRLVLALSKCVHELAAAASKAKRIASFAIQLHTDVSREPRKKFLVHVQHMYDWARQMLSKSLEALETIDAQKAIAVVRDDDNLDVSFDTGVRHLVTFMLENPANITSALDMIFVIKALERIGDHACHIAEQVIFIDQGRDVRYLHPDVLDKSQDSA